MTQACPFLDGSCCACIQLNKELLFFLVIVTNARGGPFCASLQDVHLEISEDLSLKQNCLRSDAPDSSRVSACPVAMKLCGHLRLQWHQLRFVFRGLSASFVLCQILQRAGDAVPLAAGVCSPISSLPSTSLRCWRGTGRKVVAGTENLLL